MAIDTTKVFYPEAAGMTRSGIAGRIIVLSQSGFLPNFGQVGIGAEALVEVMEDEVMVQEFVDLVGQMYQERHDYASPEDWQRLYYYRYAKLTEYLVDVVHHRGGPD